MNQKRSDSPDWPTDSQIPKQLPNMDRFCTRSALCNFSQNQSNFSGSQEWSDFYLTKEFLYRVSFYRGTCFINLLVSRKHKMTIKLYSLNINKHIVQPPIIESNFTKDLKIMVNLSFQSIYLDLPGSTKV